MVLPRSNAYTPLHALVKDDKAWDEMRDALANSLALTFLPIWLAGYSAGAHVRPRRQKAISATPPPLPKVATPKLLPQDQLAQIANDAMTTYAQQMASYLTDSTREQVTQALLKAQQAGTGSPGVLAQIDNLFSPVRAQRIAVTETTKVFGAGAIAQYAAQGVAEWEWSTCNDPWVCAECAAREGSTFSVAKDVFEPAHTNCRCFPRPTSSEGEAQPEEESLTAVPEAMDEEEYLRRAAMYQSSLSPSELTSLSEYQSGSSINTLLRMGNLPPKTSELVDNVTRNLDAAIEKGVVGEHPPLLWRTMRDADIGDFPVGTEFTDAGYVSTTVERSVADSIAKTSERSVRFVVDDLAPDQHGAWMGDLLPEHAHEREFLLPRNTKFRVTNIDADGVVHLRIVEDVQAAAPIESMAPAVPTRLFTVEEYDVRAEAYAADLTPEEAGSLEIYQGKTHGPLNRALRAGDELQKEDTALIARIDAAIAKGKAGDEPPTLFRGLAPHWNDKTHEYDTLEFNVGDVFTDKGFVSNTTNEKIARGSFLSERGALLKIENMSPDQPGAWIGNQGHHKESEFLLPRDTIFEVTDVSTILLRYGKAQLVSVRIVPSQAAASLGSVVKQSAVDAAIRDIGRAVKERSRWQG